MPPAPPGTPGASAPTTATPTTATADSRRPVAGERWRYRYTSKWPTHPPREYEIVVRVVEGSSITEELRPITPLAGFVAETRRSRGGENGFVQWGGIGIEFSPHLGAYADAGLLAGAAASGFPTPDVAVQWRQWYTQAKPLGREKLTVPAGSFETYKIEVWSTRQSTGGSATLSFEPVSIRYVVWYATEAKRYVRMQRRVLTQDGTEVEADTFELLAHRRP